MSAVGNKERVLCMARSALPESWLRDAVAIKMSTEEFHDFLGDVPVNWVMRPAVEKNPFYKQLIPYVILQTFDGLYTACYRRNGSESRLHSLWSVGIGGHINEDDCPTGDMSLAAIIAHGMERELGEEFQSLPPKRPPVFHGVINEEKTAVGNVHIGLVYRIHVSDMADFVPGDELEAFAWINSDEVLTRRIEIWSRLALNLLDEDHG